jgi:DNA-binding CsgD family transcriptional regulator
LESTRDCNHLSRSWWLDSVTVSGSAQLGEIGRSALGHPAAHHKSEERIPLDNRSLNNIRVGVPVYVLEQNPLAAEYLQRFLSKDRQLVAKTVKSISPQSGDKEKGCVLVINQAGISTRISEFVEGLEHYFQNAGLVFLGELDFWWELQGLGCRQSIGFVTYPDIPKKLVVTIKRIASRLPAGGAVSCQTILAANRTEQIRVRQAMTKRETEILELIRHRLSNKEIANILNVAEVTVKFHVSNIFSKAGVDRRRDLLALIDADGETSALDIAAITSVP